MLLQLLADGSLLLILTVALAAGVYWLVRVRPPVGSLAPYVIMAGLTSLLVGKLMSFWQPEALRPFAQAGVDAGAAYIDNPGFPSDHALLAVVVVMTLFLLTPYKKLSYGLMVVVLVMSVARVAALVHTPLDIVGGIVAGLVGTVWYVRYLRLHPEHKH